MILGRSKNEILHGWGYILSKTITIGGLPISAALIVLSALAAAHILLGTTLGISSVVFGVAIFCPNLVNGDRECWEGNIERYRKLEFVAQLIGSMALIILSSLALSNILGASVLAYASIGIACLFFIPSVTASIVENIT